MTQKDLGDCYREAAKYVLTRRDEDLVLVHGRPTLQVPPHEKYGHAWVENRETDQVIDPTADFEGPRFLYYTLGNIQLEDLRLYTYQETGEFILFFGHWGPWEGPEACPPLDEHEDPIEEKEMPTRSLEPESPESL
jgi:hypothetical protein